MPTPPAPLVLQNCCTRADGSAYAHPGCGCPTADIVALSTLKNAAMCGWCEFGSPSAPPRFYRQYSASGNWSWSQASPPGAPHPVPIWTEEITFDSPAWSWNPATGALEPSTPPDDFSIDVTNHFNEAGVDDTLTGNQGQAWLTPCNTAPGYSSTVDLTRPVNPFSGTATVASQTEATFSVSEGIIDGSSGGEAYRWTISDGTLTISLFDEDTESDALARAEATTYRCGFGQDESHQDIFTLRENRADTAVAFTDLRTVFALICRHLVAGLSYRASVTFERRTATGYGFFSTSGYDVEYGGWADAEERFESDVFTAEGETQVVGGTWADANADDEIDPDEVTPETAVPDAAGYQYRVKDVFVEMVEPEA